MNKIELQQILTNKYSREIWQKVLREVFSVRAFQQNPAPIMLSANEIAESAFELGSFETADERLIGLYEVNLNNKPRIWQNKVGLRELLRSIYKYDVDGALVVFTQGDKWRLSFISEIAVRDENDNLITQKTEPKRFTYLFGKGETVRTAANRFELLNGKLFILKDLHETFSVEKLNKDFFKDYKGYFEKFSRHLADTTEYRQILLGNTEGLPNGFNDEKAKPIRDFAKILLGRLVFLQFLQKKGWMGVSANRKDWQDGDVSFIQNLFSRFPDKIYFHSKALKTLFFETLNTKRENDLAPIELGANIKIPYLNGGLFDSDISTKNDFNFPPELFKDLLDFFQTYNFTIDENDTLDREVGIDPEMLGHIFENLLEENREKGAFYTPKEIVKYMCQESLIEYLKTSLNDESKHEAIENLVRFNQVDKVFTEIENAKFINQKLKEVKICDPAIGSGAFPMGLLKEIFESRRVLYGYLKLDSEKFDPAQIKREIIQQNIYGVDVENGAVEIARLRFWLALVVDELEPSPLPNLDYKIMQGNSLLERFEDIDLKFDKEKMVSNFEPQRDLFGNIINPTLMDIFQAQQQIDSDFDITKLENIYFSSTNANEKKAVREKIERLEKRLEICINY